MCDTPISFRQFSSHWTLSQPFAPFGRTADGRTDGHARSVERRHGGRRDAARPAESRSALVRHRALEKLQQPSDIPAPHSSTHRPSRIHVRGYTPVCVNSYVYVRAYACTIRLCPCVCTKGRHTDVNAIPRFSSDGLRARTQGWSGVYDRVRERTRDWSSLPPSPSTATTTDTSTRFPSFSQARTNCARPSLLRAVFSP